MAGITHEWNGTVLTITSDSGSSSCDLKGATGDTGIRGPQGPKGEKGNGIDSVNGKIGDVVLTYEDVGALPNTYVAPVTSVNTKTGAVQLTYSDVNAAAANHTHTASDVGALAAGGTAADSSKLGGKAPEYYIQPRNLLVNSDFRNPVNQRGVTSETDILRYAYFIDRWHNSSDITTKYGLSNQGVTISGDTGIRQEIERIESGTVLTAAVKYGGKIICVTGTIEYNGTSYKTIAYYGDGTANIFIFTQSGNTGIMISKDSSVSGITVEWAALYEGSYTADTLPPYVPKGYGAELAECQRYYQIRSANNIAAVDMRPTMRITSPTIVSVSGGYAYSADL